MLRVIVESASGISKKKIGKPDPIAAVIFRGETIAFNFFLGKLLFTLFNSFLMHTLYQAIIFSVVVKVVDITSAVKCICSLQ